MNYEELLERGMKSIKKPEAGERFEVPKARTSISGARTIIENFQDIAASLRREPKHLLKFLLKELATKGETENQRLIVLGNFSSDHVNRKIEIYIKDYVTCPECGKPDTRLVKEKGFMFLVCEACGARHSVGKV